LRKLRRATLNEADLSGLAYGDISASGPNGGGRLHLSCFDELTSALPHYAPQRGAESRIDPDATYVM